MKSNIKDTITTICGLVIAIAGSILALVTAGTLTLPVVVNSILVALVAIAAGINGYFNGKAPDGTKKTDSQVIEQNIK